MLLVSNCDLIFEDGSNIAQLRSLCEANELTVILLISSASEIVGPVKVRLFCCNTSSLGIGEFEAQTGKFAFCARKISFDIKFARLKKPSSHLLPI